MLARAAGKIEARRAVVGPANMFTYTYGTLKILAMRDAVQATEGERSTYGSSTIAFCPWGECLSIRRARSRSETS